MKHFVNILDGRSLDHEFNTAQSSQMEPTREFNFIMSYALEHNRLKYFYKRF